MSISDNEKKKNKNIKKGGQITLNNIISIIKNIVSIIKNIISIISNNLLIILVVIYYIMIFLKNVGLIHYLGEISSSLYSFLSSLLNSLLDIIKKNMSNNTDSKQTGSVVQPESPEIPDMRKEADSETINAFVQGTIDRNKISDIRTSAETINALLRGNIDRNKIPDMRKEADSETINAFVQGTIDRNKISKMIKEANKKLFGRFYNILNINSIPKKEISESDIKLKHKLG